MISNYPHDQVSDDIHFDSYKGILDSNQEVQEMGSCEMGLCDELEDLT